MAKAHRKLTGLLLVIMLVLAACSASAPPLAAPTSVPANDQQIVASDCEADAPDCGDAIPSDEPDGADNPSMGVPVDGGLTVTEALSRSAIGVVAIQGFLFEDGSGPRLCEALAESFPPQCGGASIPVSGHVGTSSIPLMSEQGVTWTDQPVTFLGEIIDGTLVVDSTVSG